MFTKFQKAEKVTPLPPKEAEEALKVAAAQKALDKQSSK
jgi:hypothetical protein